MSAQKTTTLCQNKAMVTQPAPEFTAEAAFPDGSIKEISLSDFKGQYLVLFFYPLDWTFVCPTEIIAYSEKIEEFKKLGCAVVGASCDNVFSHLAWMNTPRKQGGLGKMNIPLIADFSKNISRDYGTVLFEEQKEPLRGLFIIDGKGILRHSTINDPPVGRNPAETLRLVEAYQFTDENGVVCPAGWQKGDLTITPGAQSKLQYFEKANSSQ